MVDETQNHKPRKGLKMPYKREGSSAWYTNVPTRSGWTYRSTGTQDKATAKAMERMVSDLGPKGKREWDLLDAVTSGHLTLGRLYDAHRFNDLETLKAALNDLDLEPKVVDWQAWLANRVAKDTARHYLVHVRTLVPEGQPFLRSALRREDCSKWLNSRLVDRATKRKYLASANSFFGYLKELGLITQNPFRDLKAPRANPPRCLALDLRDVARVIGASPGEYKHLFALMYGTGIEVSVALELRRKDIDVDNREIRAAGTKSHARDRIVRVAEWAWPCVAELIKGKLPEVRLFALADRSKASKVHKRITESVGLKGCHLHDARHHWAVRQARAGTPAELIARQLGHSNPTMVLKVYGKFFPQSSDRERWERLASKQDRIELKTAV
jgi:integrase